MKNQGTTMTEQAVPRQEHPCVTETIRETGRKAALRDVRPHVRLRDMDPRKKGARCWEFHCNGTRWAARCSPAVSVP